MSGAIVVCGFGRCGSSLLMQMLHAGGVPCLGLYPHFEDDRFKDPDVIRRMLPSDIFGKAMKILDPNLVGLPQCDGLRVIFMTRDHKQQARSFSKFSAELGICHPLDRQAIRSLVRQFDRDVLRVRRFIAPHACLELSFENVLMQPTSVACQLAAFTAWPGFDISKAAWQVIQRSPVCADDMSIEIRLMGREA